MELKRYDMYTAYLKEAPDGDWCDAKEVIEYVRSEARRMVLHELSQHGFFLAMDNNKPPQLWVWKGVPGDETAEPWQRVKTEGEAGGSCNDRPK